jgi:nucleoside-diphosphate-sugar epimerase
MRILITGVVGSLGRLLAERLLDDPGVEEVIGLDARPCRPPVPGLRFVRADLRQPEWIPLLDGVDVVLHLSWLMGWPSRRTTGQEMIAGSKIFLDAVRAARVPKVITASHAAVYGPLPDNPIREDATVHGYEVGVYPRALALLADYLDTLDWRGTILTRLRTAWPCGPHHLALALALVSGPVLACGYGDRTVQVAHEDDLVAGLLLVIRHDLPGVYNVASDGYLTFHELAALVGKDQACTPLPWLLIRRWLHWRLRGAPTPLGWVRSLYAGSVLDTAKLRAAGWTPRHTTRETVSGALEVVRSGV